MKIYNIFLVLVCGISYFNIKSGCCGDEKPQEVKINIYKIEDINDNDKIFLKYINPSENREYREELSLNIFKDKYFYVSCEDYKFLDGLILMEYSNGSVDEDTKKSYKIIDLENFERNKEKDKFGNSWNSCTFRQVKFFNYDKDNEYILDETAEEYLKNIKDKKISKILFLDKNKIVKCDKDYKEKNEISKPTKTKDTLKVKIPKRLLKDK